MKALVKRNYELVRGRKWTKLLLNGSIFQQWLNEDIDFTLGSFTNQIEWFKNNLK